MADDFAGMQLRDALLLLGTGIATEDSLDACAVAANITRSLQQDRIEPVLPRLYRSGKTGDASAQDNHVAVNSLGERLWDACVNSRFVRWRIARSVRAACGHHSCCRYTETCDHASFKKTPSIKAH